MHILWFMNPKPAKWTTHDFTFFALDCNFYFFCKYTRNVYKSTVETFVQCKLSKLKMDITLNSFCTSHDKAGLSFSAAKQTSISEEETSVSDFRTWKRGGAGRRGGYTKIKEKKKKKKRRRRMVWHKCSSLKEGVIHLHSKLFCKIISLPVQITQVYSQVFFR